ncbi:MAG TPA: hypothetical protein VI911_08760 [Patescibacteria group bacterium]|nr:hypothetical protein [Patescibacteria group bacterium]
MNIFIKLKVNMEKVKEILKYILGIVTAIIGILIFKKINDSDKIENANIKIETKEEILTKEEAKVDTEIDKKEKELEKIKTEGVQDLTDDQKVDYWKRNL